nr:polysaccharide pyruvyl transferase family protein [Clostridia bacterium]
MKIGILTHHYVNNYGAFLQAYALREALAKEYPNDTVEIINYINLRQFVINTCGWFRFYRNRENLKCWLQKVQIPITFARARRAAMHMSSRCFSAAKVNRQAYDMIFIGSDEVWNYQDWKSNDPIKFGRGLNCRHIAAYAPSVGNSEGPFPQYAAEGIRKLARISARDAKTAELAEHVTGEAVRQVLDPTFLAAFPSAALPAAKKPYVLFYYCDHLPAEIREQIHRQARELGMAVYGAGECDKRYDAITANLTPFEWVEMIRNAAFVFTGTFHGAVFSILNRKPFKVYLTNKSRIQKVGSLLQTLQLENRQMQADFVFDYEGMKDEIDYDRVQQLLKTETSISMDFLREAVRAARPETES